MVPCLFYFFSRYTVRATLGGLVVGFSLLQSIIVQAEENSRLKPINVAPPPPPPAVERNRRLALNRVKRSFPELSVNGMVSFFEAVAPDRIRALEAACLRGVRPAEPLAREMAQHYLELEDLKSRSPDEYERVVEIERLESRARELGREVRRLVEAKREGRRIEGGGERLRVAKRELAETIGKCFEGRQQNQLIELNRLEAEVKELRQLLDTRNAHREDVLAQQFAELSGEQMETLAEGRKAGLSALVPGEAE